MFNYIKKCRFAVKKNHNCVSRWSGHDILRFLRILRTCLAFLAGSRAEFPLWALPRARKGIAKSPVGPGTEIASLCEKKAELKRAILSTGRNKAWALVKTAVPVLSPLQEKKISLLF